MLRVVVIGPSQPIYGEGDAAEVITPGHIIELNGSGGVIKNTLAGGTNNKVPVQVATENDAFGGGIDDNYAVGARVKYQTLLPGCEFMGLVPAAGAAIAFDAPVTTNNAGGVVIGTDLNCIGRARTAVDHSAGGTPARIRVLVTN
jgi:hypothetical protein